MGSSHVSLKAWTALMEVVAHKAWLGAHSSLTWSTAGVLIGIPLLVTLVGCVLAPIITMVVLTSRSLDAGLERVWRSVGVCLACGYEFGRIPPTVRDDAAWVVCPECGSAWEPRVGDGRVHVPAKRAGLRTFWKARPIPWGRLSPGERWVVCTPLLALGGLLSLLVAHLWVLARPDLLEWSMAYQPGPYWLVRVVPTVVLGVCLLVRAREVIARALPNKVG
jgi:hypothetical protein